MDNSIEIPFSFYALLPNNWEYIDDETKLYAFKYQIKPVTEEQIVDCRSGQKMLVMKDKCMYLGGEDNGVKKSEVVCVLIFNEGIFTSVVISVCKSGEEDSEDITNLLETMKL